MAAIVFLHRQGKGTVQEILKSLKASPDRSVTEKETDTRWEVYIRSVPNEAGVSHIRTLLDEVHPGWEKLLRLTGHEPTVGDSPQAT